MKSLKYLFFGSRTVTQERKKELLDFCKPLGLKFNDIELLDLAFHHRSYSNEHSIKDITMNVWSFLEIPYLEWLLQLFCMKIWQKIQKVTWQK